MREITRMPFASPSSGWLLSSRPSRGRRGSVGERLSNRWARSLRRHSRRRTGRRVCRRRDPSSRSRGERELRVTGRTSLRRAHARAGLYLWRRQNKRRQAVAMARAGPTRSDSHTRVEFRPTARVAMETLASAHTIRGKSRFCWSRRSCCHSNPRTRSTRVCAVPLALLYMCTSRDRLRRQNTVTHWRRV